MADAMARHPPLRTVPKGVMHVPVTPFGNDAAVDYGTFEKLVDWHVRQKPSSLCVILHVAESVSPTNVHSAVRLRSFTSFASFPISERIKAANSSGLSPTTI